MSLRSFLFAECEGTKTNWFAYAPLINDAVFARAASDCRELLSAFIGNDFAEPTVAVVLAGVTDNGREIELRFDLNTDVALITIRQTPSRSHAGFAIYGELESGAERRFSVDSGRRLLVLLLGDDAGPPPHAVIIEAVTPNGVTVRLWASPDSARFLAAVA